MTSPTIPGKFLSRLTALGLPTDQLKKVIHVFLAFVEFRDGKVPKAPHEAPQPDLLGSGPTPWPEDAADQFWAAYPRRIGKLAIIRKLQSLELSGTVEFKVLIESVRRYQNATRTTAVKHIAHPMTWLNAGRWMDDEMAVIAGGKDDQDRNGYTALLREMHDGSGLGETGDASPDLGSSDEGHGSYRRIL